MRPPGQTRRRAGGTHRTERWPRRPDPGPASDSRSTDGGRPSHQLCAAPGGRRRGAARRHARRLADLAGRVDVDARPGGHGGQGRRGAGGADRRMATGVRPDPGVPARTDDGRVGAATAGDARPLGRRPGRPGPDRRRSRSGSGPGECAAATRKGAGRGGLRRPGAGAGRSGPSRRSGPAGAGPGSGSRAAGRDPAPA